MRPTRRAVLAATVSSIALAGCTGDDGGQSPEPGDGGGGDGGSDTDGGGSGAGGSDGDATTPTASPPATGSPMTTASGATVQVRSHPDLGEILVDPAGMTLYMFDSDTQGDAASSCSGGCADAWPPLTVEDAPTAGDGVAAELSTFEREDGSTQVAADGWPLYYYASDGQPGDAAGQGANDVWWVLRPDGTPVRPGSTATPTSMETGTSTDTATPSSTATPATTSVQARSHSNLGEILVDSAGQTLYMFDSDTQGEGASTCSGGCADAWPPLTVDGEPAAAPDVTAELTTFEREDGSMQVAADGWPLYYYASDAEPGDATGQGANDVWWVLDPAGRPVRQSSAATPTVTATPTDTSGGGGGPY